MRFIEVTLSVIRISLCGTVQYSTYYSAAHHNVQHVTNLARRIAIAIMVSSMANYMGTDS
jgi:hypothetical protein